MIQFNLLPDVKLEFVKANRLKHSVSVIAIAAAAVALFIFVVLIITVDVIQKAHLSSLNNQISTLTTSLKSTPNLNAVLTVQDEVNALPSLHAKKPVATRLPTYLAELTPTGATISELDVNFSTNVMTITGSANSLATVNQFVDTLKLSSYQTSPNSTSKNAFSNVILSSFQYTTASGASYSITATFDPAIFSAAYPSVSLNVPSSSSTHSNSSGQSQSLFQNQSSSTGTGN